jgi:hypothetical protein
MSSTCLPMAWLVGRISHAAAAPVGTPWMWTLIFGHHEDRTPTHGYEPTREAGDEPDFAKCPQSEATRKTFAPYEFFSV